MYAAFWGWIVFLCHACARTVVDNFRISVIFSYIGYNRFI